MRGIVQWIDALPAARHERVRALASTLAAHLANPARFSARAAVLRIALEVHAFAIAALDLVLPARRRAMVVRADLSCGARIAA
jgi:hypothetical protein